MLQIHVKGEPRCVEMAAGDVGDPDVPPMAPAVASAAHALTGIPVRSLPIEW